MAKNKIKILTIAEPMPHLQFLPKEEFPHLNKAALEEAQGKRRFIETYFEVFGKRKGSK